MTSQPRPRVLVADDDDKLSDVLVREIGRLGFEAQRVSSGAQALEFFERDEVDVLLLDLRLGDADGIDILRTLNERGVSSETIILTGHGSVENAIAAMKAGAYDFITKPCKLSELEVVIGKAVEARRVKAENRGLRQYLASGSRGQIVSRNPAMRQLLESLERVARADAPVLILGESGTGKELVAREIHHLGPGNERPFVTVNCAVLQTNILESELFGHEKGAFTGAAKRRLGLFEIADGGSMFLDEIGEIDESIQAKLLRVLQFGEFRRVGGNDTLTTRVRIIAATNKDLEAAAQESRFRQDLFFRLNVVQLHLPPLRERPEDIEALAAHFLRIYGGNRSCRFTADAVATLRRYSWPGNIRELENVVRRLLIFYDQEAIDAAAVLAVLPKLEDREDESLLPLAELEKRHILRTLASLNGKKTAAADALGISLKTLYNKLHSYGWSGRSDE